MFFPLIDTDTYHRTVEGSEDATPLPIILQNIGGYHWVTFKLKRSIKILRPRPPPRAWNYFCNKLGKDIRYPMAGWSRYLHFVPKPKSIIARKEDSIST